MTAPDTICQLVKHFEQNHESFRSGKYNEAQLRQEFLNPFFEALGWDMFNKQGYAETYKDVIHEASLDIEGAAKAPDYAFRIGGTRKFFVEAKKPAVNIQYDIHPAFQVRRYAWSAKLSLSILTDFEEFAVYDCRSKPNRDDKAATGRVMFLKYDQYVEKWDEIAAIFSRDAVLKGSFDKYAQGVKGKRGTLEVDDAFLKEIEHWRNLLARNLALRNKDLNVHELNYAVQMIINRILFLRICEDRGIEREGLLQESLDGGQGYENLCQLFRQADSRYNSGLFHFVQEKGQSSNPDDLTLQLEIDDKVLKDIIGGLYYPAPYVFREIPADIMGQVYERFLGKIIRLTAGHQAKVEDKPEVRKAGGVYYTPTYIVDYIVKNTVGELLEGKTPKEAASLKILDPACGSGSFLLGAYQYLLDWHLKWYGEHHPEKLARAKVPVIYQVGSAEWRLTTAEKKRILQNNIYGVDIDPQAVEVTKLSLLLKVLEGESQESIGSQLELFKERALLNLGSNIQCGNSLIGPDFYAQQQISMFEMEEEERYRINVFDWNAEFKEIMSAGGFDAVIGNPPWAFTKYVSWGDKTKDYLQQTFLTERDLIGRSKARQAGKINLFSIFMLRGLNLLNENGLFGYIIPNTILRTTVYDIIRKRILENFTIKRIVDLKTKVFKGVTASTVITFISPKKPTKKHQIEIIDNLDQQSINNKIDNHLSQLNCLENPSYVIDLFIKPREVKLYRKLGTKSIRLSDTIQVLNGIATHKNMEGIFSKKINDSHKPILFGKDIKRYNFSFSGKHVEYDRNKLLRARSEDIFLAKEKIIMQRIGGILISAYDDKQFYTFNSVNNLLLQNNVKYNLKYILALLNSKLLKWVYFVKFSNKSTLTVNISKTFLDILPICTIDFDNPAEVAQHDKMVSLVEAMLQLNKDLAKAQTPQEQQSLQRQIGATDKQIDSLVYELYDLTEEEIGIVEGG